MKWLHVFLLLGALILGGYCTTDSKLVCYVGTWAAYRPDNGKFNIENIDPFLCTHLVYAFAGLDASQNSIVSLDSWQDLCTGGGKCGFQRFVDLKKHNPSLKTILAVGGWNEGSSKYSKMAKKVSSRQTFIQSCVELLLKYHFDGLDMDWEYPTERGGNPEDKDNYFLLLEEMKKAFEEKGLLLSAALPAGIEKIDKDFKAAQIFKFLDFASIMTYDYHGSWEQYVHHHAPVHQHPQDKQRGLQKNIISTIENWISVGAPANKLVLGIPTYGHSFTLADPDQSDVFSTAIAGGQAGPYTRQQGILGYNEMCEMWKTDKSNWQFIRDAHLVSPYAVYNFNGGPSNRNQWVGYDDQTSILKKCDLVRKYNLGGAMVWSLETDDFHGECGTGSFPLVNAVKKGLEGGIVPTPKPDCNQTTTTTRTTTTTTTTSTTTHPPQTVCKHPGLNGDPHNCQIFYQCWRNNDGSWEATELHCPSGLAFNPTIHSCDWPANVDGCS